MNTIQFQLSSFARDDDQDYLVVQIIIDGVPFVDFEVYSTDLAAVSQSIERPGPTFIITCWCGMPACVGLRYGINIYHEGTTVRWRVHAPLPERTLYFDRDQYISAYQTCLQKGKRLIANRRYTTTKPYSITPDRNSAYFPAHANALVK
jgi:hypothetical protein